MYSDELTLYHTIPTFNDPWKEAYKNIVGKGENAGNQHLILFPPCFLPFPKQISIFQPNVNCLLQMLSKNFSFGKELTLSQTTQCRLSKLKELADDNFKFDENGKTFSKRIENTVGKGEIAP